MSRTLLLAAAGCLLAGCYAYDPAPMSPVPGSRVRLHLTNDGAVSVAELLGTAPRRDLDGTLQTAGDTLRISVVTGRATSDFEGARAFRAELAFPREQVDRVSIRRFSWGRTLLVSALAGGIVSLAVNEVVVGGGGDAGDGGTPSGRQPLFIFKIPIF